MHQRLLRFAAHFKGRVSSLLRVGLYYLAYKGWLPRGWVAGLIAACWENIADDIHEKWGHGTYDFEVLAGIIERYRPQAVLDAECGSGRLFPLYQQCGSLR